MKCKKNSYEYLRRLFKKEVGISATQLVKKMKIDNAVKLINMHKGIISVEKLSIESGFIDQEYFSRIFKTYIGIPPLKYIVNVRSV
ncbi:MAG: helix-turn-helix domain-containing protein, partial [Clostridiales bacterium]|jgi:YesN/AraC family two-component response regulator|nr:helix-turn-helix domain-containing protein [Clostridiales bacterium]